MPGLMGRRHVPGVTDGEGGDVPGLKGGVVVRNPPTFGQTDACENNLRSLR